MFGKLDSIIIECTNLQASQRFYTETLCMKVTSSGEGWACVDGGAASIVLWQGKKAQVVVGFSGADLGTVKAELEAKGCPVSELMQHPGGAHYDVTDPDGNAVMIADR
jgi:catechol-2,3-dioxygenase